jgi:hypothetical protein
VIVQQDQFILFGMQNRTFGPYLRLPSALQAAKDEEQDEEQEEEEEEKAPQGTGDEENADSGEIQGLGYRAWPPSTRVACMV